jgi:hypothetical protein
LRKIFFLLLVGLLTMWGTAMAAKKCHPAPKETICDGEEGHAHDLCESFCMNPQCTEGDHHSGDHHSGDSYGHKSTSRDHSGGDHSGGDHHGDGNGDCNGDCGGDHHDESDCEEAQHDFEEETGRPMPCQISCPCTAQFPLFAGLANGSITAQACIASTLIISITTPQGTFAIVNNGASPPFCSVNAVAPFLTLTAAEATACRDLLNKVATAQNIVCVAPE